KHRPLIHHRALQYLRYRFCHPLSSRAFLCVFSASSASLRYPLMFLELFHSYTLILLYSFTLPPPRLLVADHRSLVALAFNCHSRRPPSILNLIAPMPINTIIVDDEKPAREELAFLLKAFPEINLLAQGKNGLEAVNLIKEHSPDLLFLDVQMPGLDGFGVLKKLVERKLKVPHVVFATAFDQYAVQAFDVNAVDYILKPFDQARLQASLQNPHQVPAAHAPGRLQRPHLRLHRRRPHLRRRPRCRRLLAIP